MKINRIIQNRYLWLPIAAKEELREINIVMEGTKQYSFMIPVDFSSEEQYFPDYYAAVNVSAYQGNEMEIEGDFPVSFGLAVRLEEDIPKETGEHPAIHFAARCGWINDPNGLYYQNGQYHLYFQYNEFNTQWENMSWGHAVSTDLLHWKQLDTVLYPDENGTVYSGCAVLNEKGLLDLPKGIPLYFYTEAGGKSSWSKGKKFIQKLAYSLDGGNTLIKTEEPLIGHIVSENRDPKVYWHEEANRYYMILYLDKFEYAIFNSKDLKEWEMTQRFTAESCWECPDLREIPCEDGTKKWVFWCADGYYMVVEFDGKMITTFGKRKAAYHMPLPYAAQTFYGTKDRVIIVPWMRTENEGTAYRGLMGLPRELTLLQKDGEYVLAAAPVKEFYQARKKVQLPFFSSAKAAVELVFQMEPDGNASVSVYGMNYEYHAGTGILKIGENETELIKNLTELHLLIDKELVEISAVEDTFFAAVETKNKNTNGSVKITAHNKGACVTAYMIG